MSNKILKTRIQHKIDTYAHWELAKNFIPLEGELIIYTTDEYGNEKIGLKIGNGDKITNVHDLPFIDMGSDQEDNSSIVVDTELSSDSENPIANKAVYEAIEEVAHRGLDRINGYAFRVASTPPTSSEVDDYTITFII